MLNEKQCQEILEILMGGGYDYAELFLQNNKDSNLNNFNNQRFSPTLVETIGTGIRVWKGKEITYYSLDSIEYSAVKKAALNISGTSKTKAVKFTTISKKFKEHDWKEWTWEKISQELTNNVNEIKKLDEKLAIIRANISISEDHRLIATSDGSFIEKTTLMTKLVFVNIAQEKDKSEMTFYIFSRQLSLPEVMTLFKQPEIKKEIFEKAKIAVQLLEAPKMKAGKMPVILPTGFGAVLFHEAVGHPLETRAVSRNQSQFANKIGEKVASNLVTLVDDGTINGEVGTSEYDDEGVLNQRRVLIDKGVLKGYLADKFSGQVLMNYPANGAGRRQDFRFNNTSRMSNTFVLPGTHTEAEMIKSIQLGLFAKSFAGGQVDPFTGQFNFGIMEGYLIKNGQISHLVSGASIVGNGLDIIKKVDMISKNFEFGAGGVCGSSSGLIPVGLGQPTLRISEMNVGGI